MYKIDGKLFDSPQKAYEHVENTVADMMRTMRIDCDIMIKSEIPIIEWILKNRKELVKWLSVDPKCASTDHCLCEKE